jgi:hypothetical protein
MRNVFSRSKDPVVIEENKLEKLKQQLRENKLKYLLTLHLVHISIDTQIEALLNAIPENSIIETINLSNCKLDATQVVALVGALRKCPALKSLTLNSCKISPESAISLAAGLTYCRSLKKLNLANNDIDDVGASALAKALENSALEELDIGPNFISSVGLAELYKFINHSLTLNYCYFPANPGYRKEMESEIAWIRQNNRERKKVLALHANLTDSNNNTRAAKPPITKAVARDGDHAVAARVLRFLMEPKPALQLPPLPANTAPPIETDLAQVNRPLNLI